MPTALQGGARWLDHCGTSVVDGVEIFVAEPYSLTEMEIVSISLFAEEIGSRWRLAPSSWHYPGQTLRVEILPPPAAC